MTGKAFILRVLAVILILIALVSGLSGCTSQDKPAVTAAPTATNAPTAEPTAEPTVEPTAEPTAEPTVEPTAEPTAETTTEPTAEPTGGDNGEGEKSVAYAVGYVRVITATQTGWLPLPTEGESTIPLRQVTEDGKLVENVIHLTPRGVYMESATCDNQDCVHQGEVTLENKADRALENMIICLPNQVCLELYSIEELLGPSEGAAEN